MSGELENDRKAVVASMSAGYGTQLGEAMRAQFPEKIVMVYTASSGGKRKSD